MWAMWRRVSCEGGALQVFSFVFALLLAGVLDAAPPAQASEATITVTTTPETSSEKKLRRTREAEAARIGAETRAINQLGYPRVYDLYVGGFSPSVDVYALSNQIARLAAHIQMLSQRAVGATVASGIASGVASGAASGAPSLSLPALPANNSLAGYGPEGPTAKSIRLILEYRLMVAGNPRLKIGKVNETKDKVTAQVVTTGGRSGVKAGDMFIIERVTKTFTDPTTGQVLGSKRKELGVLRLNNVQEKMAFGGFSPLKKTNPGAETWSSS